MIGIFVEAIILEKGSVTRNIQEVTDHISIKTNKRCFRAARIGLDKFTSPCNDLRQKDGLKSE